MGQCLHQCCAHCRAHEGRGVLQCWDGVSHFFQDVERIQALPCSGCRAGSSCSVGQRWATCTAADLRGRVSVACRSCISPPASCAAPRGSASHWHRQCGAGIISQPGFVLRLPSWPLRTRGAKLIVLSLQGNQPSGAMHSRTASGKNRGAAGSASSPDAKAKSAWCGPGPPSQAAHSSSWCNVRAMVVAAASSAMQRRLPRSAGQHVARSSTLCGRPRSYGLRLRAALARKATNRVHRASSSVGGHFATARGGACGTGEGGGVSPGVASSASAGAISPYI